MTPQSAELTAVRLVQHDPSGASVWLFAGLTCPVSRDLAPPPTSLFILVSLPQVGKDYFGDNYIQNFKDNSISTGMA